MIPLRSRWILLPLALCLVFSMLAQMRPLVVERLERQSFDWRMGGLPDPRPGMAVVLVHAGEPTFRKLGEWPWPRSVHAELLAKLGHARLILLDILFPEQSRAQDDDLLATVVQALGKVVVSVHLVPGDDGLEVVPPYPALGRSTLATGVTSVSEDIDGLIRAATPVWETTSGMLPSLSLAGAVQLLGAQPTLEPNGDGFILRLGERSLPLDSQGRLWVQYGSSAPPTYEYLDVLNGTVPPETFAGKVVVVGIAAAGLEDFHVVPQGLGKRVIPGSQYNAEVLRTLLDGHVPTRIPPWAGALLTLVLSLVGVLSAFMRRPREAILLGILILGLFLAAIYIIFVRELVWIDMVLPAFSLILAFVAATFIRFFILHRDWSLKTYSIDSLHDLHGRDAVSFESLESYLHTIWPEVEQNTGARMLRAVARPEEFPEALRQAHQDTLALNKGTLRTVLVHDKHQPLPYTMAVPLTALPGPDAEYALIGWRGAIPDETLKTMATTLLSVSWFFQALKRSHERKKMLIDTIHAIFRAIDTRDPITGGHSDRVAKLSLEVLEHMDLDEETREDIYLGALIHDIGKIGIPDTVLNKPARLTTEEFITIKTHPELGRDIMDPVPLSEATRRTLFEHHERWDGSGYPQGLKGQDIFLGARILAVVDVFDALGSDRPYREATPLDHVCNYLWKHAGILFDESIVDVLLGLKAPLDWQKPQ